MTLLTKPQESGVIVRGLQSRVMTGPVFELCWCYSFTGGCINTLRCVTVVINRWWSFIYLSTCLQFKVCLLLLELITIYFTKPQSNSLNALYFSLRSQLRVHCSYPDI